MAEKETAGIPVAVVEALIAKIAEIGKNSGGITADQFAEVLKNQAAANADAIGKLVLPENKRHPGISVFSHPEGELERPKGRLRDANGNDRETIFCGARQEEDLLTPAEIDAFNAIREDCESRSGSWWAKVRKEGKREKLFVYVPCAEIDDRMGLPSTLEILTELAQGAKALDMNAMLTQLNDLKAKLEAAQVVPREAAVVHG